MNSLIQSLFHTPEFRRVLFALPLCVRDLPNHCAYGSKMQEGDSLETPSALFSGQKREILFNFQKLFVEMAAKDIAAASTKELTDSFGW